MWSEKKMCEPAPLVIILWLSKRKRLGEKSFELPPCWLEVLTATVGPGVNELQASF